MAGENVARSGALVTVKINRDAQSILIEANEDTVVKWVSR